MLSTPTDTPPDDSLPNNPLPKNPRNGPSAVNKARLQGYRDDVDKRKQTSSGVVVQQQRSRYIPDEKIDHDVGKFAALVSIFLS